MYRFFVDKSQIDREQELIHILGNDVNHIKNVLRMKPGEQILISAGEDQEYTCQIQQVQQEEILAHIQEVQTVGMELPCKIYLFQGLPKSDKMELIVQKAVELGAYEIIPVATKRAVVKLDEKKALKKVARWRGIAESGAKQSGRNVIPKVTNVMSYKDALTYAKRLDVLLIPYELAEGMKETKQVIEEIKRGQSIGIFIGPEGGFETQEVEDAIANGARAITLGKRILRTETAGLTTLSILMYHLEE